MRLHVRSTLALLAVVVLVLGLRKSIGFWSTGSFIAATSTLLMTLIATIIPDRVFLRGRSAPPLDVTDFLLMHLTLLTVGVNVLSTGLAYAGESWAKRWLIPTAFAGLVVYLSFVLAFQRVILSAEPRPVSRTRVLTFFAVTLVLGFAFRGLVLIVSPDPIIDVYALARDNADHVLHGRNPYQNDIVSPYDTAPAYARGIFEPEDRRPAAYPPHSFLMAVPFRAFGGDPRWPNVIGDVFAAIAIFGVGWNRQRPITGYLAATMWLFIPRSAFIMEQAWFEPMLGGFFGLGLWFSESTGIRKWIGYILLGFALTAKQFGLPLLPALFWPHRHRWRELLAGLAVGGLIALPFLLWSPSDFIDIVLKKHLGRPPQYHSITVASAFYQFQVQEPSIVDTSSSLPDNRPGPFLPDRKWCWLAAIGLIGIVSLRAPRHGAATGLALGTALMIFSTFHTQGFPNYFYLVEYLWLLGAIGLLPLKSELANC